MKKPGINPEDWKAITMPFDTFVALANNTDYSTPVVGFTYGGMDVNWTAVPVPTRLLGQSHLLAYIYSFLSSDGWSGTCNYTTLTGRKGANDEMYTMNETYIPVVNSVDLPGVKSVFGVGR